MADNKYNKAVKALNGFSTKTVTPIKAWGYGEALKTIRQSEEWTNEKKKYDLSISKYLFRKHDIDINEHIIPKYIMIFDLFDYQLLKDNPSLEMERHIEYLINNFFSNKNEIKKILEVLKHLEYQYDNSHFIEKYKLKTIYREINTEYLFKKIIDKYDEKKTEDIAKLLLSNVVKKAYNNKKNRKIEGKKNGQVPPLKSPTFRNIEYHNLFEHIKHLYKFQPVDEQGLIGLFFTIYNFLSDKNNNFLFSWDNQFYRFSSVKLLQTKFPDATLIVDIIEEKTRNEQGTKELGVEFEYKSNNFNTHSHIKEGKCNLVICWEDNWEDNVIPILCIKDTLKQGKIVVKNV